MKPDLALCEREPLAFSSAIQAHGFLLAIDSADRLTHCSNNLVSWFNPESPGLILGAVLPEEWLGFLRAFRQRHVPRFLFPAALSTVKGIADLLISRLPNNSGLLLELTPSGNSPSLEPPDFPSSSVSRSLPSLLHWIADMTGYDRVLSYRFLEDGDGIVDVEERRITAAGSYLGLRFPASDIPQVARDLYLQNPWRSIPDAASAGVQVHALSNQPLIDLTHSALRSVSPVHQIYLSNMGVRASLSFPVVVGGNLHSLISCHHSHPQPVPFSLLERIAGVVKQYTLALTLEQSTYRMNMLDGIARRFSDLHVEFLRSTNPDDSWNVIAPWVLAEFDADGLCLCTENSFLSFGESLDSASLPWLNEWFCNKGDLVWACDSLIRAVPNFGLSKVAGVIALRLGKPAELDSILYICRTEYIHEVGWGGNPDKPVEYHDGALGISPRRSFERWIEKRLGYSRPWDNEAKLLALKLRELWLQYF